MGSTCGYIIPHSNMKTNKISVHDQVVWEALVDAGFNPETMRGSKTGVWVACSRSETGEALCGKEGTDIIFYWSAN